MTLRCSVPRATRGTLTRTWIEPQGRRAWAYMTLLLWVGVVLPLHSARTCTRGCLYRFARFTDYSCKRPACHVLPRSAGSESGGTSGGSMSSPPCLCLDGFMCWHMKGVQAPCPHGQWTSKAPRILMGFVGELLCFFASGPVAS